jgi:hypothetical protein
MTFAIEFLGKILHTAARLTLTRSRYTRQVILSGTSPYHSRTQLRSLDLELSSFEESLPDELQLNDNRLMIMCHSDEARAYTMLHTLLLSSRCDLHRFLIPGIRESVSPEAMNQTPREYIDYCQQRCLQTALKYMETNSRLGTPTSAVVTYQVVKVIDHLAGFLPLHGDTSLSVIKQRLVDILLVVSGGRSRVGWTRTCVSSQFWCCKNEADIISAHRHRKPYTTIGNKTYIARFTVGRPSWTNSQLTACLAAHLQV